MKDTYKFSYKTKHLIPYNLSVYNVGYQKCEPGYKWGPGIRDHYCLHHIISGSGSFISDNKSYDLKKGDTFMLYPGLPVQYSADACNPWEYAWVGFMGQDAGSILHHTDFTKDMPVIENSLPQELIYKQLMHIYHLKGNQYADEIAMTGALYTLLSCLIQYSRLPKEKKDDLQMAYVEKAIDFISIRYSYPITVDEIAEYTGISRSHLYRSFQNLIQQSPKEYLNNFRIKQACRLLKETRLSVGAIAHSVGFENNLYFSKAFKKNMGINPSQYREKIT